MSPTPARPLTALLRLMLLTVLVAWSVASFALAGRAFAVLPSEHAGEFNRAMFALVGHGDTALVVLLAVALALGRARGERLGRAHLVALVVLGALASFLALYWTPQMVDLGRAIRAEMTPEDPVRKRFGMMHGIYSAAALAKTLLAAVLAVADARRLVRP